LTRFKRGEGRNGRVLLRRREVEALVERVEPCRSDHPRPRDLGHVELGHVERKGGQGGPLLAGPFSCLERNFVAETGNEATGAILKDMATLANRRLLSTADTAAQLGVSPTTIYRLAAAGALRLATPTIRRRGLRRASVCNARSTRSRVFGRFLDADWAPVNPSRI